MDKTIYIPSIMLALPLICWHLYRCNKERRSVNHAVLVNTLLQSSGIVCGLLLMASTVFDQLKAYISGIELYIFIGGIAVLAVSAQGIYKDIFSKHTSQSNPPLSAQEQVDR